jgi:hypothetical protein
MSARPPHRFPVLDAEIARLRARLAAPMASARLPADPLRLPIEGQHRLGVGAPVDVDLLLAGAVNVSLINEATDQDDAGILASSQDPDGSSPALPFTADRAWLRYALSGQLGLAAGRAAEGASAGFDAQGTVELLDYRPHPRGQPLGQALADDLGSAPRFAFSLPQVLALGPHEAVAVRVGGRVGLTVELRLSDVLGFGMGSLAGLLGSGQRLGLQVDAGATIRARVELGDQFLLVLARQGQGFRVGLRKSSLRGGSVTPSVGVSVSLARADVVGLVGSLLDRLTGASRQRLAGMRDDLADRLEEAARAKISAGFRYEYARLAVRSDLLALSATAPWVASHHASLTGGRIEPLLDSVRRGDPGVRLERFLDRRSLRVEQAWGFTLGMDRWWSAAGRDAVSLETITRTLADGRQARSYLGMRSYEGALGGSTSRWSADFRAETRSFSAGAGAQLDDHTFGLSLTWSSKERDLSAEELATGLDAAVLWNALPQDDARELQAELRDRVGRPGQVVVQLILEDETFRAVMAHAARLPASNLAGPLAAAMPYWALAEARTTVHRRRELYTPLWKLYLSSAPSPPEQWARTAERHLADGGRAPALARLEGRYDIARPFTFAGLIELNGDTARACSEFHQALAGLHRAMATPTADDQTVPRAFAGLRGFWAQSHHLRAAGVYCLDAARLAGLFRRTRRSVTIETEGHPVLVLGSG